MATKASKNTNGESETSDEQTTELIRTDPIDVGPDRGGNVLAAWQGLYHLLHAQFDEITVVPGEGVVIKGLTFADGDVDPQDILEDISGRTRRVDFVDAYPIVAMGQEPPLFATSLELTKWMQQYFRKPGEDGKSPDYVKRGIATYKKEHGFPPRKGRPKKVVRIDEIGHLDPALLEGVNMQELEKLLATVTEARNRAAAGAKS